MTLSNKKTPFPWELPIWISDGDTVRSFPQQGAFRWLIQQARITVNVLADLETAVEQLPYNTRSHEAEIVANVLQQQTSRRRGAVAIGELLTAVLARLGIHDTNTKETGDRPYSREDPTPPFCFKAFLPSRCMALCRITTA